MEFNTTIFVMVVLKQSKEKTRMVTRVLMLLLYEASM